MSLNKILLYIILPLVILIGGYFTYYTLYRVTDTYVIIDINPSIELEVSRMGNVIEVEALNYDAEVLLSDLDLVGLSVEDATGLIASSATEMGFIDEFSIDNEVVITVCNDDEDRRGAVEEELKLNLEAYLEGEAIPAKVRMRVTTEAQVQEAEENNISIGKLLYVERAAEIDSDLDKNELIGMSMQDINDKIYQKVNEDDGDNNNSDDNEALRGEKVEQINSNDDEIDEKGEALWEDNQSESAGNNDDGEQNKEEEKEQLLEQERNTIMSEFKEQNNNSEDSNSDDSEDPDDEVSNDNDNN